MSQREGFFWDIIEGRRAPPASFALLGWKLLAIDPARGTIKVEFQARPEFMNPLGSVQGGFLAAMLDDTMSPALVATLKPNEVASALELKISFHYPAQGGTLIGEGRILHRGRSIAFLQGELRDEDGLLVASASATAQIHPAR